VLETNNLSFSPSARSVVKEHDALTTTILSPFSLAHENLDLLPSSLRRKDFDWAKRFPFFLLLEILGKFGVPPSEPFFRGFRTHTSRSFSPSYVKLACFFCPTSSSTAMIGGFSHGMPSSPSPFSLPTGASDRGGRGYLFFSLFSFFENRYWRKESGLLGFSSGAVECSKIMKELEKHESRAIRAVSFPPPSVRNPPPFQQLVPGSRTTFFLSAEKKIAKKTASYAPFFFFPQATV